MKIEMQTTRLIGGMSTMWKLRRGLIISLLAGVSLAIIASGCAVLAVAGAATLAHDKEVVVRAFDANGDQKIDYTEGLALVRDLRAFEETEKMNMDDLRLRHDSEVTIEVYPLDARDKNFKSKDEKGKPYEVQVVQKDQNIDVVYFGRPDGPPYIVDFVRWLKAHGRVPPV